MEARKQLVAQRANQVIDPHTLMKGTILSCCQLQRTLLEHAFNDDPDRRSHEVVDRLADMEVGLAVMRETFGHGQVANALDQALTQYEKELWPAKGSAASPKNPTNETGSDDGEAMAGAAV